MKADIQPVVILLVKGLAVCRGLKTSAECFLGASLWNSFLIDPELTGGLTFPVGRYVWTCRLILHPAKWKTMGYWMKPVTSMWWGWIWKQKQLRFITHHKISKRFWCLLVWDDLFVVIQTNTLVPRNCQNDSLDWGDNPFKGIAGLFLTLLTLYCPWTVFLIWTCLPGRRPQPCEPGFPFLEQSLDQVYGSRNGNTHSHPEAG